MVIKLLQWNIWHKEKFKNIHRLIRDINPDIVCLQEISVNSEVNGGRNTAEVLAEKLGWNYAYKDAQKWESAEYKEQGNAILSKFPIISATHTYLQEPLFNTQDFTKEGRVYLETELSLAEDFNYTVGTTHLSYSHRFQNTDQREKEFQKLWEIIKTKKENYIFTGDLNATPDSYIVDTIATHLKHAGPDLETPTWTTKPFDFGGFNETKLQWRLDYVFATEDMLISKAKAVQTHYSDHLPLLIDISV